ncbi:NUDIX domain-containing protein [Rhodococcus gordoniae]|uniref:NUDIX domain-containing protein n=1 Tax=Rhodococcus gordoniae TaxID=223392 RepID=UPI001ADFE2F4|nr:NUDIX domain-containing protein [Rhodococcus gordoniae]
MAGEAFFRAIGGGIEFGEMAEAALRREFTEELGVTLGAVELLGVVENIFEYEANRGHEIAHVFAVESAEIDAIPLMRGCGCSTKAARFDGVSIDETNRPFFPAGVTAERRTPARGRHLEIGECSSSAA